MSTGRYTAMILFLYEPDRNRLIISGCNELQDGYVGEEIFIVLYIVLYLDIYKALLTACAK